MKRRSAILPLLVWLAMPALVNAQAGSGLCWTAHPQPRCGVFLVTNAGLYTGSNGAEAVFEGGFMVNVTQRDAVGPTLLASVGNSVAALTVHYRHWLSQDASVETAVGVPTDGQSGVVGLLKVNPVPWVGFAVRPRLLRYSYQSQKHFDASAGVELDGPPGLVASALALLAFVAFAGAYGGD